jgi:hypothetical protein
MSESFQAETTGKAGFTRRRFIIGGVGVSAVAAIGGTTVRAPRALAASAPSGPPTTTIPLPTTTKPEQLLLTWGGDPATQVTVSWSAPGTVAQPVPTLAFSTRPITAHNPGLLVKLPDPKPLDVTERYLVLGGGGTNGPTNTYGTDAADDKPQAKVITTRNAVVGSEAAGFSKNGADSVEDAPWSAAINPTDAYGYSIFDVDPGERPGDTTITFQYFAIPAVTNEAGTAHDGTTTLPSLPTEKFTFGRKVGKK